MMNAVKGGILPKDRHYESGKKNGGGEMFRQSGLNGVKQFHAQGRSDMR